MAFTHTVGMTYKNDAGSTSSTTTTTVGPAEENLEITVPVSTTNAEHDLSFAYAKVLSCDVYASGALTIKTNDTTSPGDTLALVAGQAMIYASGTNGTGPVIGANPFTADVTKFYVTNASSTVAATLKVRVLLNL